MSRATDDTGYVQPTFDVLLAARGPSTAYHFNHIRAWKVGTDGAVKFAGAGA
jgi:sulfane dehydrogenase subunit SoxC